MEVADPTLDMAAPCSSTGTGAVVVPVKPPPSGQAENIAVCIRVRPLNDREVRNKDTSVLRAISAMNLISVTDTDGQPLAGKHNVFQYDHIFDDRSSTRAMYDRVAQRIVKSSLDGINGTIFAYGQTSSGKTYTMTGGTGGATEADGHDEDAIAKASTTTAPESMGILQLAVEDIFSYIEQSTDRDFLLRVSFVEIYNEVVKDLLNPSDKGNNLKLREDPRKGVYVESKEEIITTFDDILRLLHVGNQRRTVGHTAMNDKSSRSHSIFRIVIESKQKNTSRRQSEDDVNGAVLVACLSLVDLAGSESMRHTAAEGQRQREAGNINKSLLTLSRVINSLASSSTQNAPFRDSKLTRLLQNSLDGNTRTLIICCVTPADRYLDETKSTLQFAARAKTIQTSAYVNEILDDQAQLKRLKKEVHELKKLVNSDEAYNALKAENEALQDQQSKNKTEITRLLGLVLSSTSASVRGHATTKKATQKRHKRMRETWHPGDFEANKVAAKAAAEDEKAATAAAFGLASPNPKPRKRTSQGQTAENDSKENVDPQNLMAALDDAAASDDDDDLGLDQGDDEGTGGRRSYSRRRVSDTEDPLEAVSRRREARKTAEEQVRQLVELLECALVRKQKQQQSHDDSMEVDDVTRVGTAQQLDLETRVLQLVQDCEALASAAQHAHELAGEQEILKMAIEELQTRLQLASNQEQEELVNTKELLSSAQAQLAEKTAELEQEQAQKDALAAEKASWEQARARMEAKMVELVTKLDAMAVETTSSSSREEDLVRQNEQLKLEMEEIKRVSNAKLAEMETTTTRVIDELSSQLQDAFVEQEELKLQKEDEVAKLEEELLAKSAAQEAMAQEMELTTKKYEELTAESERLVAERSNLMDAMVELEEQLQQMAATQAKKSVEESVAGSDTLATSQAMQERIQLLEQQLAQAQIELDEASNDQEAEANRADDAMREMERAQLAMEELQQQHTKEQAALHEQMTQYAAQVEQGQARLTEMQHEIQQVQAAETEARKYRDFLQAEMDELNQRSTFSESAKNQLVHENTQLRQQVAEMNTFANEVEGLTECIEALQADLDTKSSNEKTWKQEIKTLLLSQSGLDDELAEKKHEIVRLQEQIQKLDNEKAAWLEKGAQASSEELQAEIVRMREERWGLATKWEESEHALAKERRELQRFAKELEELQTEQKAAEQEKKTLVETLEETQTKLRHVASELDATQTEKDALEEMVSELETKFGLLGSAKTEKEESLQFQMAHVGSLSQQVDELRGQLLASQQQTQGAASGEGDQERMEMLAMRCQELEAEKATVMSSKEALVEELNALESQLMALTEEKMDLASKLDAVTMDAQTKMAEMEQELQETQRQLVDQHENKRRSSSSLAGNDSELAEHLETESRRRAKAEMDAASYKEALDLLQDEFNHKSDAYKSLQIAAQEATSAKEQLDQQINKLRDELARAKEEQDELRYQNQQQRQLAQQAASASAASQEQEKETLALQESISTLEKQLEVAQDALLKMENKWKARAQQAEDHFQKLQEELRSANAKEEALDKAVEMLGLQLRQAKETLVKTESEWKAKAQQAESHFRRLQDELREAKEENGKLAAEADDQQKTKDALSIELEVQLTHVQQQLQSLAVEKQQLEESLASQAQQAQEREDALSRKASFESASLREQCHDAQAELMAYQKYADDEISRLRGSVQQNDSELLEVTQAAKQREQELQDHVEHLSSELDACRMDVEAMRATLKDRKASRDQDAQEWAHKLDSLTQQLAEADEQLASQSHHVAAMKAAIEKLEGEAYQHRNELEEMAESLKSSQMEATHYHNELVEAQLVKEKMDSVVETQKLRIEKLEKVKMTTETLDLFRKLKNDRQDLQMQVQKMESQLKEMASAKLLSKEASDQQQARLMALKEQEIGMFTSHVEELKAHVDELKRALQNEKLKQQEMKTVVDDIRDKSQQELEDMKAVLKEKSDQVEELQDQIATLQTNHVKSLEAHKTAKETYLEKENLELLVENRQLKKKLDAAPPTNSGGGLRGRMLEDDGVAQFEASARAASALLAEPSAVYGDGLDDDHAASTRMTSKTPEVEQKEQQQNVQKTPLGSRGGLSSFLMSSSGASATANNGAAAEEEEEARPACSQQ